MSKVSNDGTCLISALTVIGMAKAIIKDKDGDFEAITSEKADDLLGGQYHPSKSAKFLIDHVSEFASLAPVASGKIDMPKGPPMYVAACYWTLNGDVDDLWVMGFDEDLKLLAIMTALDWVQEFGDIIIG